MTRFLSPIVVLLIMHSNPINAQDNRLFDINKNIEIFLDTYRHLNEDYVDNLDPSIVMRTAIDAMVNSMDPYTNYISESQIESYRINEDDKYQGIGAKVDKINDRFVVIEPYENGPAFLAGIKPGDIILSVDGTPLDGLDMIEANAKVRGLPGTQVLLEIQDPVTHQSSSKTMTRGEVNIPNVPYSGFVHEDIGYISLTIFTQMASKNILKAFQDLKSKNPQMKGLILDLRDNGGGLLFEAINICNIFIPPGETVVTTKGKTKENNQSYKTAAEAFDSEMPLVVLINKSSASASEIVSGVIQDLDRGVIIGQKSFGKGLVQNTRDLVYNSRLKLTTSKYYIPSGRCIQGLEYVNGKGIEIPIEKRSKFKTRNGRTIYDGGGVMPDIEIPITPLHPMTKALIDQHIIFDFVNDYCRKIDSISDVNDVVFTDFDSFKKFIDKKNYTYTYDVETHLEKALTSLSDAHIDNEAVVKNISNALSTLKSQKEQDLSEAKKEILYEVEKGIVNYFLYQKGKTQHRLKNDEDVTKAINILTDMTSYTSILTGNK